MISVYLINFGTVVGLVSSIDEGLEMAKNIGYEIGFLRDGVMLGVWGPITGYRALAHTSH